MSNKIVLQDSPTGRSGGSAGGFYAVVYNEDGSVWNGSSFTAANLVTWSSIGTNLSEVGSTGIYTATFPGSITDQMVTVEIREQFSASKNVLDDRSVGRFKAFWDGSDLLDPTVGPLGDETYAADGAVGTLKDFIYMTYGMRQAVVSGTSFLVKGLDGTTTKMTFTLDDANNPMQMIRTA